MQVLFLAMLHMSHRNMLVAVLIISIAFFTVEIASECRLEDRSLILHLVGFKTGSLALIADAASTAPVARDEPETDRLRFITAMYVRALADSITQLTQLLAGHRLLVSESTTSLGLARLRRSAVALVATTVRRATCLTG